MASTIIKSPYNIPPLYTYMMCRSTFLESTTISTTNVFDGSSPFFSAWGEGADDTILSNNTYITWQLTAKDLAPKAITVTTDPSIFTINSTNCSSFSAFKVVLADDFINLKMSFVNKVSLNSTSKVIGSINLSLLGYANPNSYGMMGITFPAYTDGGNGIAMMGVLNTNTGYASLVCYNVINKSSAAASYIPSNSTFYLSVDIPVHENDNRIADSFCDKYYVYRATV